MRTRKELSAVLICSFVAAVSLLTVLTCASAGSGAGQGEKKLSDGGYSIFHETMVDLTYQEVEAAAKQRAVVLWPMGVIEEHGPHLPLGTDIYNAYAQMKQVARLLKAKGKSVLVAPPMYWGINDVTGDFAGSFSLRPSTLKSLIEDTFSSLRKDGFRVVYIVTGHGDKLHNKTILEGVEAARSTTGMRGFVVISPRMKERLGLTGKEAHVVLVEESWGPPPQYLDVHAGMGETSVLWHFFPGLVKAEQIPKLVATKYGQDDLTEWRKGWEDARAKTPLGYFGDPASADPTRGAQLFNENAAALADAIVKHMEELSMEWAEQVALVD